MATKRATTRRKTTRRRRRTPQASAKRKAKAFIKLTGEDLYLYALSVSVMIGAVTYDPEQISAVGGIIGGFVWGAVSFVPVWLFKLINKHF